MSKRVVMIVTIALLLSNAMNGLDSTIISTALPAIISDLHGIQLMGWIVAVFLLGGAVTTPLWSKFGERVGNKRAYQISTLIFVLGALLEGLAPNIIFLIIARTVMGVGSGGMTAIPYIIYAEIYQDPVKRGKVFGYVTASFSTAAIIGPLVGGFIVDNFGWHWVFYINVPIGLASIAIIHWLYQAPKLTATHLKVDYLGAMCLTSGLVSLLVGIEMIGKIAPLGVGLILVLAVGLLGALLVVERRASDPIIPSRLFKNRYLVAAFGMFFLIYGFFVGFNVYVPMWAQGLLGTTAVIGGVTQIPGSITNFMGAQWSSNLDRNWSTRRIVMIGFTSLLISCGLLVVASAHTSYGWLLLAGAFQGAGIGICFTVLQVSVQQQAAHRDVPIATSFSLLVRMLGQTFMASIYSVVLNQALTTGVRQAHGNITMTMLNQLSDATSARTLPVQLIPAMRAILYTGLHHIMGLAFGLLVLGLVINVFGFRQSRVGRRRQHSLNIKHHLN
ncbi:MFS transporter [Lactobacillus sp. CBA3606]|uniref:MFS transporter n=1 Tax=Lactobacillus sp. CBA3606 TaxID=2099789 RepID=UPI000CFD7876|nr:MFS transporter [Lactobacillus sp. CBA3606]AVK63700.1 MFS transporter [Lactobacillus sp. CBA3606]